MPDKAIVNGQRSCQMTLRISGNQLRFRISHEELGLLCTGKTLEQQTPLPGGRTIAIAIRTIAEASAPLKCDYENDRITLFVDQSSALALLSSLPNKEGIETEQILEGNRALELQLEIDIRTQKRNRVA